MERQPEPHELMDDMEQAQAYAESDFTEPHNVFIARFRETFPDFRGGIVLDIGSGNADPTIRFAKAYPEAKLVGIDGSEAMTALGRKAVEDAGLADRIGLRTLMVHQIGVLFDENQFDAVISNSFLHHLDNPHALWLQIGKVAKPDVPVFVMDLRRPDTEEEARHLVEIHSQGAPELMRRDFYNSLLAAFRPEEVREQLSKSFLSDLRVGELDDRHMIIHGLTPPVPRTSIYYNFPY